jgi:phosphatidate cytidylyltransferase
MKTRIIVAAIGIPLLLAVLLFLPPVFLAGLVTVMNGFIAYELLRATGAAVFPRFYICAVISAAAVTLLAYLKADGIYFQLVLYLLTVLMFIEAVLAYGKEKAVKLSDVLTVLFAGFAIPLALSCLIRLKMGDPGRCLVMLPFICTMVSDSGAYFTGVYLGKHKGVLKVSPNKSLEGFIGSLASLIVGMMIYGLILRFAVKLDVNFGLLLIYAVVGNLMTQLGDLAFSFIKRENGIKDYGNLIPGHGGMLDRFDSMIFAAPVIYIMVTLFPAF